MKIEEIHLEGFATFRKGVRVKLDPDGVNVIVGQNEAGKSTLLRGILAVLFGLENAACMRRYRPWDGEAAFRGSLALIDGEGRRLRIARDFESQQVTVEVIGGGRLFEGRAAPRGRDRSSVAYENLLRELLVITDERMFRNTVFLAQQELQIPLGRELRRLLSGTSDCDYQTALEGLQTRQARLEGQGTGDSRSATALAQDELETRRHRLHEGRRLLARALDGRRRVSVLSERSEELEDELQWLREEERVHEELLALLRKLETARSAYEDVLGRQEVAQGLAKQRDELEDRMRTGFAHFRQAPRNLPELLQAHLRETEALNRARSTLAHAQDAHAEAGPAPSDLPVLVAGVGLALATGFGMVTAGLGLPLSILNGALLGCLALLGGRHLAQPGKRRRAELASRVEQAERAVQAHRRRLQDVDRTGGPLLGERDPQQLQREFKELQRLREERRRVLTALDAVGDATKLQRRFEEASRGLSAIEIALDEMRTTSPELAAVEDLGELETTVRQLEERCCALASEHEEVRTELEERRVELAGVEGRLERDLSRLEDEVREGEENLEELKLESEALAVATTEVEAAVRELEDGDLFRIGRESGELFKEVTASRYDRVHLGAAMEPVVGRGDERPIRPEDLSQGAQDQLYFALRVAMARHLAPRASLPLFLDDTFVNYDRERLEITRRVLSHLGGHQILLVSCDRAYVRWGDRVIDLDQIRAREKRAGGQETPAPLQEATATS